MCSMALNDSTTLLDSFKTFMRNLSNVSDETMFEDLAKPEKTEN